MSISTVKNNKVGLQQCKDYWTKLKISNSITHRSIGGRGGGGRERREGPTVIKGIYAY